MGYPGDQGKPGGWPPRQPPHAPYGPGAEAPPYGNDNDEAPFAPRDEGPGMRPFGDEPLGGPADQTAAWADEPVAGNPPGPQGSQGSFPLGQFDGGQYDAGQYGGGPFEGGQFDGGQGGEPYGSFEGAPPGPPGPPGGPVPPPRGRNLPLIIGGSAVAGLLLIGGGVGLSSVLKGDSEPKDKPSQAASKPPATPSPTKPVLAPVKLQSRATDPAPLTLKEVFGNARFKADGHKYVRTAVNAKKRCTGVAGGRALDKALKRGSCTQALRATYALSTGSLIGTVGVFNLETEAAAKKAVKAAADKDAFLLALPGKGVSKTNGKGEALGTSQARGHYLVMTWVQRPDGKKIAKKYHAAVRVFGTQMVKGSNLALALHYRETEGKPLKK